MDKSVSTAAGAFLGCLGLALLAIVVIVLSITRFGCTYFGGIYERVASPDAMITNYEWYEQQVKDIKAMEGQIKDAEESLSRFKTDSGDSSKWSFDQRQEYQRLGSNVTGLKSARRNLIQNYNAKASMITRNMWKHPSLPHQIEE